MRIPEKRIKMNDDKNKNEYTQAMPFVSLAFPKMFISRIASIPHITEPSKATKCKIVNIGPIAFES